MRKHIRGLETDLKLKGIVVEVRKNRRGEPDMDTALRILKKKLNKEGVPKEMRKREYFESKGQIRRRKKAEAIRRHRKMLAEDTEW